MPPVRGLLEKWLLILQQVSLRQVMIQQWYRVDLGGWRWWIGCLATPFLEKRTKMKNMKKIVFSLNSQIATFGGEAPSPWIEKLLIID